MNPILAIAFEVRLVLLFVLGACVGSLANLGIYRLAWHPRPIGPWVQPDPKAPPRRLSDRIPIVGWLGLRREAGVHGSGFWIRPLLVELLIGIGFAVLYWWEIGRQGLLPPDASQLAFPGMLILHAEYAAHLLLISLMVVAAVIDVDEKIIPDTITVPGVLLGLLLAAAYPWSLLPEFVPPLNVPLRPAYWRLLSAETWQILQVASPEVTPGGPFGWPTPHLAPQGIRSFPQARTLAAGLACWWLWCVALMPRTWYARHGWRRAIGLSITRLVRERVTYLILIMALVGSANIGAVWCWGGLRWTGLLSALIGMAGGGGLIWMVRIIGTAVLRREAMGFGDVTLMAMIGTFLGWQTCLVIFFLAPFAALLVGGVQWVLRRDNVVPYGPFLCLAAVGAIVCWVAIWEEAWLIFEMGWLVPVGVLACMALLAVLLGLMRLIFHRPA